MPQIPFNAEQTFAGPFEVDGKAILQLTNNDRLKLEAENLGAEFPLEIPANLSPEEKAQLKEKKIKENLRPAFRHHLLNGLFPIENKSLIDELEQIEKTPVTDPKKNKFFAKIYLQWHAFMDVAAPKLKFPLLESDEARAQYVADVLFNIPKEDKLAAFTAKFLQKLIPQASFSNATPWALYKLLTNPDIKNQLASILGIEVQDLTAENLLEQMAQGLSDLNKRTLIYNLITSEDLKVLLGEEVQTEIQENINIILNTTNIYRSAKVAYFHLSPKADDKLIDNTVWVKSPTFENLKTEVQAADAPSVVDIENVVKIIESTPDKNITSEVFFTKLTQTINRLFTLRLAPTELKSYLQNMFGSTFPVEENDFRNMLLLNVTQNPNGWNLLLNNRELSAALQEFDPTLPDQITDKNQLIALLHQYKGKTNLINFINRTHDLNLINNFNAIKDITDKEIQELKPKLQIAYNLLNVSDSPYKILKLQTLQNYPDLKDPLAKTEQAIRDNDNVRISAENNKFIVEFGKKVETLGFGSGLTSDADYAKTATELAQKFRGKALKDDADTFDKLLTGTKRSQLLDFLKDERVMTEIRNQRLLPQKFTDGDLIKYLYANRGNLLNRIPQEELKQDYPEAMETLTTLNKSLQDPKTLSKLSPALGLTHYFETEVEATRKPQDPKDAAYKTAKEDFVNNAKHSDKFNLRGEQFSLLKFKEFYLKSLLIENAVTDVDKLHNEKIFKSLETLELRFAELDSVIRNTGHWIQRGETEGSFGNWLAGIFGANIPHSSSGSYTSTEGDIFGKSYMKWEGAGVAIYTKVKAGKGMFGQDLYKVKPSDYIKPGTPGSIPTFDEHLNNAWERIAFLAKDDGLGFVRSSTHERNVFTVGEPVNFRHLSAYDDILKNPGFYGDSSYFLNIYLTLVILPLALVPTVISWLTITPISWLLSIFGPAEMAAGKSASVQWRFNAAARIIDLINTTPLERARSMIEKQAADYVNVKLACTHLTSHIGNPLTMPEWALRFEKEMNGGGPSAVVAKQFVDKAFDKFNAQCESYARHLHATVYKPETPVSEEHLNQARKALVMNNVKVSQNDVDSWARNFYESQGVGAQVKEADKQETVAIEAGRTQRSSPA